MTIGFTLLPVGIKYSAGCGAYPAPFCEAAGFGNASNWAMALFVIVAILLVRRYGRGVWSTSSVFIGLVVGYLAAIPFGMVNPDAAAKISDAAWIGLPGRWFGLEFTTSAALGLMGLMIIMAFITTIETVGDISGITAGGADREPTDRELKGGIMADGLGSAVVALFGGLPNTSYSQNVGLVSFTRMMSRHVVTAGAVFLILCGLVPKLAAVVGAMPQPVLGGAAIVMFGLIVSAGLKLVARSGLTTRNMLIAAISLGLGMGLWQVEQLARAAGVRSAPARRAAVVVGAAVRVRHRGVGGDRRPAERRAARGRSGCLMPAGVRAHRCPWMQTRFSKTTSGAAFMTPAAARCHGCSSGAER